MRINRLFEIVYLLLNKKIMTAKELAEHFEISVRTVYRDIEILIVAGIPIYASQGRNGGIKLLDNFVLNKSLLSKTEQNEILYALQSFKAANYPKIEETLVKLNAIFKNSSDNWIEIDFSGYGDSNREMFNDIKKAILDKKVIHFEYYNSKGIKSERNAEPLKLFFKMRYWYLFAFCLENNEIRQFKITRIKNLSVTEKTFDKSIKDFEFSNNENDIPKEKITVLIDKSQAYRVFDEFSEKDIKRTTEGNFEITTEMLENEWLYGYLLSFGEHLKILEPNRLKKILAEKLVKMIKNYE